MLINVIIFILLFLIIEIIEIVFDIIIIERLYYVTVRPFLNFCYWLFSPFFHLKRTLFFVSIKMNPWRLSIKKICKLNDEQFNKFITIINNDNKDFKVFWKEYRLK